VGMVLDMQSLTHFKMKEVCSKVNNQIPTLVFSSAIDFVSLCPKKKKKKQKNKKKQKKE
jgi:hypothetical protein